MEATVEKKTIWGFGEGDVVTSFINGNAWYEKRVVITEVKDTGFYGKGPNGLHLASDAIGIGIALLERPEYEFKVGDKVKYDGYIEAFRKKNGKVIVLNPDMSCSDPFLVDFPGQYRDEYSSRRWFNKKYIHTVRIWCTKHDIELIT